MSQQLTLESAKALSAAENARVMKCVKEGNADGIAEGYTQDARVMPAGHPDVVGQKAVGEFFGGMLKGGINGLKLDTFEYFLAGENVAIEYGEVSLFVGEARVDHGRYIVQWKFIDGKPLVHWDMFSSFSAPPPAAAPAK